MLPFAKAYLSGETPNPCVLCNRQIKYGLLLEEAVKLGADYMATGHYARNIFNPATGQYQLFKGLADRKDQAYVMHGLTQKQLSRILFPNGSYMSKEDIREVVAKREFSLPAKKTQWVYALYHMEIMELLSKTSFLGQSRKAILST